MDGENIEDLLSTFPHAGAKSWLLGSFAGVAEIPDPYLLPDTEAEKSLQHIAESVRTLLSFDAAPGSTAGPKSGP
jgi:protein-tyrosine-phosphatase